MKPNGPPITPAGLAALRARYDHLLGTTVSSASSPGG